MQFNDTDHAAFAKLSHSVGIELTSYSEFAGQLNRLVAQLHSSVSEAEGAAEDAEDFIEFTRDLYRTFGPHACSKPTDGDLAALVASARELLARNGVNP